MTTRLDDAGRDLLFFGARSASTFLDKPVDPALFRELYDLMRMGPTSLNTNPARLLFLTTADQRERLRPALSEGNLEKTIKAPVTVIIGYDTAFYEHLPKLFPGRPAAKTRFEEDAAHAEVTGFRNGTLQGAYFILAARAVGLDCGPMSGFNNAKVDEEFFAGTTLKSNFLCNLGYADRSAESPPKPRFDFDEICQVL